MAAASTWYAHGFRLVLIRPMQRQVERNLASGYRGHLHQLPQGSVPIFIATIGALSFYTDGVDQVIIIELVDQQDVPRFYPGRVRTA